MRRKEPGDVCMVFNVPEWKTEEISIRKAVEKYANLASRSGYWIEVNLPGVHCIFFSESVPVEVEGSN